MTTFTQKTTALGAIRNQAVINATWVASGVVLGAINNVLVLPTAFGDFKEGWGLLKSLVSYAMILVPLVSLGTNSILIKYLPLLSNTIDQKKLNGLSLLMNAGALALFGVAIVAGYFLFDFKNLPPDQLLLAQHVGFLTVMVASLTVFQVFAGYCVTQLKTTVSLILGDTYLKAGYLLLACAYLWQWIDFNAMVWLYTALYFSAALIVFFQAYSLGFRAILPRQLQKTKEIIYYGLFNILDKASAVLVINLDIVMLGLVIDLSSVADYTLAFFIGSVIIIPQRAIQIVSSPLTSKALAGGNITELRDTLEKVALNQVLFGGLIFVAIWSNVDGIIELLPPKFQNGKWVVFYIGLSRMTMLMASTSSAIMVYSTFYKSHLYFNILLVALTIATNMIFIPQMGISGAALATFISLLVFMIMKLLFVHRKFAIHPFTKQLMMCLGWIALLAASGYYLPFDEGSFLWVAVKSSVLGAIFIAGALIMKLSPDVNKLWNKWTRNITG